MSFLKDPDSTLDYRVDWSAWLAGDIITTSTWIVPTGIVKTADSHADDNTTIWLAGGTIDTGYQLVNRITTAGGRTEDRTIKILVRSR